MNAFIRNNKIIDNLIEKIPGALEYLAVESTPSRIQFVSTCIGVFLYCAEAQLRDSVHIEKENKDLWSSISEKSPVYFTNKRSDIMMTVKLERLQNASNTKIGGTVVEITFSTTPSDHTEKDDIPGSSKGEMLKGTYTDRNEKKGVTSHSQRKPTKQKRQYPTDMFNKVVIPDDMCSVNCIENIAKKFFSSFKIGSVK